MSSTPAQSAPKRGERFFHSVIWSWLSVGVSLFSGLLLAPYTIHKLGDEAYGVWTIILAFVDYFWLMDLGFRSATLKYTAHYRALEQPDKINEVINTALIYASCVSALTITATILFSHYIARFEHITPKYHHTFVILILLVGVGWGSGAIFNLCSATVEGHQRFDLTSRIWIVGIAIRALGMGAVLYLGHGLLAMGAMVVAGLVATYALSVLALLTVFPQFRLAPRLATYSMFRQMLHYGINTFLATISLQVLNQSAPILIGHFLPTAFAGYYGMAMRLPQYSVDMVARVGFVTGSHSAELAARGDFDAIARMGIYVNRYCFMLFAPVAMSLCIYGRELFRLWIKPEFAVMSAPLLPAIAIGVTLGVAAQFNSSSILYGLGKHRGYAVSLMLEALCCVTGLYLVTPRFGLQGVALLTSGLIVLNRGFLTSWLLCRALRFPLASYLAGIYVRPFAIAVPVVLAAVWVKHHVLAGATWLQVIAGGAMLALSYYALGFFFCLQKEHRSLPIDWVRARLGSRAA